MPRRSPVVASPAAARSLVLPLAFLLAACSGGGSGGGGVAGAGTPGTSGDFLVLSTNPKTNSKLFLNDPVSIDFSNSVDLSSVNRNTFNFTVFDLLGNPLNEQPAGTFRVVSVPGDPAGIPGSGRRLQFLPKFPSNRRFDDGGFKPGRRYVLTLVGGDARFGTVLLDVSGRALRQPVTVEFSTAGGLNPADLFRDQVLGGPARVQPPLVDFETTPMEDGRVTLGRLSQTGVEITLRFNQPLNPSPDNVPVEISPDPTLRIAEGVKGRIFLEYDDIDGETWIPATVDLEINDNSGATVVLRPIGVLPNNALVRVIVENTLEDLAGESNVTDAGYIRIFETFRTAQDFEPQFDAIVEAFLLASSFDPAAAFLEPQAELVDGRVRATFDFEGDEANFDYAPIPSEVTLNTNFTQIIPVGLPAISVTGGVFRFRQVLIRENVTVRASGSNPMVWLVNGDFTVNGKLSVEGGEGESVTGLGGADVVVPGGAGNAGGGDGGAGSPVIDGMSERGENGAGPGQLRGLGGQGGILGCDDCRGPRGSGGGGGSFATQGDPHFPVGFRVAITQVTGDGGKGCAGVSGSPLRINPGGNAAETPFFDRRKDNDFWGSGVDISRGIRIAGELALPRGGSGGGAGGDRIIGDCSPPGFNFLNSSRGGGGGGGGGVLIIKALGRITIGPQGKISADGGHGGGGQAAGSNNEGGGGGAGAGGMVVLMSGVGIDIFVHSSSGLANATYGEGDANFAISADGGICKQGSFFSNVVVVDKYSEPLATTWDDKPTGGFGGMGLVQLMVPPGDDSDGTGNRLDDNIRFLFFDAVGDPQEVSPLRKKQLLAWRGWPNEAGTLVDDLGDPTDIGDNEGDIRPSPIMLPGPFGHLSRARSIWIDTGASQRQRRDSTPAGDDPRVVVTSPSQLPNPDFSFAGTSTMISSATSPYLGYADFGRESQIIFKVPAGLDDSFPVTGPRSDATFAGGPAYRLTLPLGSLGNVDQRYANHRAVLLGSSDEVLQELRILGHQREAGTGVVHMFLSPDAALPQGIARVRVLAKFFELMTDDEPGLGPTFDVDGVLVPIANVQIGFAFHTDPNDSTAPRYPARVGDFAYDLSNPELLNFLDTNRPTFVQWDLLFNARFHPTFSENRNPLALTPGLPLPELSFLLVPFRF